MDTKTDQELIDEMNAALRGVASLNTGIGKLTIGIVPTGPMDSKATAKFQDDLRKALGVLASFNIRSGESAPDLFGMRGMAQRCAESLQAQRRPLAGHVKAAMALCLAVNLLDGAVDAAGLGAFMRQFAYQAAHLLGQAEAYAATADSSRRHGGKRRTKGLVTPFLDELLASSPNAGGTELARQLLEKTGRTVSPEYVNRLRRNRKTTT